MKLDLENAYFSKNIEYYISGKFSPVDSTKSYTDESNIRMVDNFVAHLFPQIQVKKHSTVIDEIWFTGIPSTVKGCVSYSGVDIYNGETENSGFRVRIHKGQNFEAVGKLGDLGLGFFNGITIPIYKVVLK